MGKCFEKSRDRLSKELDAIAASVGLGLVFLGDSGKRRDRDSASQMKPHFTSRFRRAAKPELGSTGRSGNTSIGEREKVGLHLERELRRAYGSERSLAASGSTDYFELRPSPASGKGLARPSSTITHQRDSPSWSVRDYPEPEVPKTSHTSFPERHPANESMNPLQLRPARAKGHAGPVRPPRSQSHQPSRLQTSLHPGPTNSLLEGFHQRPGASGLNSSTKRAPDSSPEDESEAKKTRGPGNQADKLGLVPVAVGAVPTAKASDKARSHLD